MAICACAGKMGQEVAVNCEGIEAFFFLRFAPSSYLFLKSANAPGFV